jgi:CRP/FNR family transcriptional regulator, cyclic AMP receptor protein
VFEHAFFTNFAAPQRAALVAAAVPFAAAPDELMAQEGKPADAFYLIEEGRVAIELHRPGKAPAHLQTIGPNEAVGWSWAMPPFVWEFDARALVRVKGARLEAAWLREACEKDIVLCADLYKKLVEIIASRLTAARLQLLDIFQ